MNRVIKSESDLFNRIQKMDEDTAELLLIAFKIPDLYAVMMDDEKYHNVIRLLDENIKKYQFYKSALEELDMLCRMHTQEELPEVIVDNMLDSYAGLDKTYRADFRRKMTANMELDESLNDLGYNFEKFRDTLKKVGCRYE